MPRGGGRKFRHCCAGKPSLEQLSTDTDLARIRKLRDAGRLLEAIRLAQAHIARHPRDPVGHAELGMAFRYAGRSEEAAQAPIRAIRLAPDVADHHNELGGAD